MEVGHVIFLYIVESLSASDGNLEMESLLDRIAGLISRSWEYGMTGTFSRRTSWVGLP
jgi:hypothetical protein